MNRRTFTLSTLLAPLAGWLTPSLARGCDGDHVVRDASLVDSGGVARLLGYTKQGWPMWECPWLTGSLDGHRYSEEDFGMYLGPNARWAESGPSGKFMYIIGASVMGTSKLEGPACVMFDWRDCTPYDREIWTERYEQAQREVAHYAWPDYAACGANYLSSRTGGRG